MNEAEALKRMVPPGKQRPDIYRGGILQVHVTRACDKACVHCTQGSQLGGKLEFMPPELFRAALRSLRGYFGVIGMFGGNPAMHPQFTELCRIMREEVPDRQQRGLWCNHPRTLANARAMQETFNPHFSNINVHMDAEAASLFKQGWPECFPFGLKEDSRHSPVFVSMLDVGVPEARRWELIASCDINQKWSALVGMFRGQLRGWFCEIAGAQAMLHQYEPDYPDTGIDVTVRHGGLLWWQLSMPAFAEQARMHCHSCSVPLRGYGALACDANAPEQVSRTHATVFKPKRKGRRVELVTIEQQLGRKLNCMVDYMGNSQRPEHEACRSEP